MRQSHRFGALFRRRLFGATNNAVYNVHRMRSTMINNAVYNVHRMRINNAVYNVHRMKSTIYVPLVKTLVLMSLTFAGIFPSCHPTSSFLLSSMPSAFSRVFCESRLMAFSFGHTMMLVSFHLHPYFLAFLGFLGNLWVMTSLPRRMRKVTIQTAHMLIFIYHYSQKWPYHDQVVLWCKAGRWDSLGCASPETGSRRDHGCSSHSAS